MYAGHERTMQVGGSKVSSAREKEMKVNHHEDHEATCLCCAHCKSGDDPGWSSVSPGMGPYISCGQQIFTMVGPASFHETIHTARTCDEFKERQ